jgi:Fe-S-cluster containining protein
MINSTFDSLMNLYKDMDDTWNKVALQYDFKCDGCEDNCCKSLFFHHSFIEKAYLLYGLSLLDTDKKKTIISRAQNYYKKTFSQDFEIKSLKIMCPLNEKGRCLLYLYRPMICRLHGLPHELCRPGFQPVRADGCNAGNFSNKPYIKFDRTLFYQEMAQIEMAFRQNFNKSGKLKETVAQMIISQ